MGLEVRGVKETTYRLNNVVSRTNRKVYALMERAANDAKRRVELQAHVDTGALENAIRVRRLVRAGIRGRTSFEVFIDPQARRSVKTRLGIRRQRVTTYAKKLESGRISGIGPGSRAKNMRIKDIDPELSVGPGFFYRSLIYVERVYRRRIERAVSEVIRQS